MTDELKFLIDGREYPFAQPDTLTMGEAMVVHEYSGLTLDQIEDNGAHPGLIAAYAHIAYQRGNPDLSKAKVRDMIENSSLMEAISKFAEVEDDAGPPELSETGGGSERPNGSAGSSGAGSTTSSAVPATGLHRIGAQRSATSATSK